MYNQCHLGKAILNFKNIGNKNPYIKYRDYGDGVHDLIFSIIPS